MTQPAIARFEAGAPIPTLPLLERLAEALGLKLTVTLAPDERRSARDQVNGGGAGARQAAGKVRMNQTSTGGHGDDQRGRPPEGLGQPEPVKTPDEFGNRLGIA